MGGNDKNNFHYADYIVFGFSLAVSVGVGVYFAFCGKRQQDTKEYLLGGGNLNPVAVGLSLFASLINAVFLIGVPAEVYYFGTIYLLITVSWVITIVIAAFVFVPFYRRRSHISVYAYLEDRFDSVAVRVCASATFALSIIIFLAVVLYAPALAIEAVTDLDLDVTLTVCGLVCTVYVALGGLKAVVWTDAIQMTIIIVGTIAIAIIGVDKEGGAQKVWKLAVDDKRVNFDQFSADPQERHTVWTQCIGQVFIWLPVFASNQMCVQRYYAVSSTLKAQIALFIGLVAVLVIAATVAVCSLVMNSTFNECDPRIAGRIEKPDQLFPLLVMELIGDYHGLPGLYIAAVFAAALSSISSGVNSLAAVILEDFVKPLHKLFTHEESMDETVATWTSKGLSLFFGLLTIALSYVVPHLGDELIQLPTTIWGVVGAPLFGVFILAMVFPWANWIGALAGLGISLTFSLWISIGDILHGRDSIPILPLRFKCGAAAAAAEESYFNGTTMLYEQTTFSDVSTMSNNYTTATTTVAAGPAMPTTEKPDALIEFYSVSYAWYGLIATVTCVLVGLIVSLITNACCNVSENNVDRSKSKSDDHDDVISYSSKGKYEHDSGDKVAMGTHNPGYDYSSSQADDNTGL